MNQTALIRLTSWLSPVFPTGGFAYSGGLEQAVAHGPVSSPDHLRTWLEAQLRHGAPWNDAVILAQAWHGERDGRDPAALAELAGALAGSAQRHRETLDQGAAFLKAAAHWFGPGSLPAALPLPVAVGLACGRGGVALEPALAAYLNTLVSNQLQCAIRLSVTGQDGAARLLAGLEPVVDGVAGEAAASTIDDLGGFAFMAEIAAMNHETLQPRLFLS
ncbi:MAG: urease accessory protein UreF [Phyllobacteriaceae bacterium]|nr:urease accessory protein UreF [Phyllobacteriaceae bacterium]MBA92535.1 urease accessory protein UreF [Phyllobacteriaceae bacterium]